MSVFIHRKIVQNFNSLPFFSLKHYKSLLGVLKEFSQQLGSFGFDQFGPTFRGDDLGRILDDELEAGRLELGGLVHVGREKKLGRRLNVQLGSEVTSAEGLETFDLILFGK